MVGSRGYFDETIDGKVNVALANRQPGSSFKPFVYATAYEKGYTPDTVVFDLQTQFSTHCKPEDITNDEPPCYSPQNFDGKFQGPITLRNAISISDNVASVKTLYLAGIKDSITTAESMGITTLGKAGQYGLTLVLGGGEVNLLDLTSAYGVFANDGVRNPSTGILRVEDNSGNVLEQYEDQSTRVLDPQIARLTNDVLSDNVARTPEFGADSPLYFPGYDVADKTGTTNDFRDVWVLGYTPGISVGAWAGNNDNSPMQKKIAAFIIAPMWHDFVQYALKKYSSDGFIPPSPESNPYSLPPVLVGNWNTDPSQGVHDILYWVDKSNPRGGRPMNPASDSQYAYWEYPVQLWASQNPGMTGGAQPIIPQNPQQPQVGDFTITSPHLGTTIPWGTVINATIQASPNVQISSVTYYLNGAFAGTTSQYPYFYAISPLTHGPAILRAVVQKIDGGSSEQSVAFTVQ
jgi:membrane peptidoglycan carboxypeptidase